VGPFGSNGKIQQRSAVSNIKDIVLIDYDRVRQMELPRTRARTAPLAKLLAIDRVLEDAGFGVTVADENPTIRRKRNIGGSAERGERGFRQSNVVNASICSPATTNAPRTA
jgi:hypothetical protein